MHTLGHSANCHFMAPATPTEIAGAEEKLDLRFPLTLRQLFLEFNCRLHWEYDHELSEAFDFCHSGFLEWSLNSLIEAEQYRASFFDEVIRVPVTTPQKAWVNTLALFSTDEGHFVALDMDGGDDPPVVMLTRDDSAPGGERISPSFTEFFEHWLNLNCVGPSIAAFGDITHGFKSPFRTDNGHVNDWIAWFENVCDCS